MAQELIVLILIPVSHGMCVDSRLSFPLIDADEILTSASGVGMDLRAVRASYIQASCLPALCSV